MAHLKVGEIADLPREHRTRLDSRSSQESRFVIWQAVLLIALSGTLYFSGLGASPISYPIEGLFAEIPREMLERKDLITPTCDYGRYLDKPPLLAWLTAGLYRVAGISEFTARFWPAVFGILGVVSVLLLGYCLFDFRTGLLAGTFYSTSLGTFVFSRQASLNQILSTLIAVSLFSAWQTLHSFETRKRFIWAASAGIAAGAAVLDKGLVGMVLPFGVVTVACVTDANLRARIQLSDILVAATAIICISAPWHAVAYMKNSDFLSVTIVNEQFLRFFNQRFPLDYVSLSPLLFLLTPWAWTFPWSLSCPLIASLRRISGARPLEERSAVRFLVAWSAFILLFFCISRGRVESYSLPAIPAVCLLLSRGWISTGDRLASFRWHRFAVGSSVFAAIVASEILFGFGIMQDKVAGFLHDPLIRSVACLSLVIFCASAWLLAVFLAFRRSRAVLAMAIVGSLALCIGMNVGIRAVNAESSFRDIADAIPMECASPSDRVFLQHPYEYESVGSLCFYTHRKIWILSSPGLPTPPLLHTGSERFFVDPDEFRHWWNSKVPACYITDPDARSTPPVNGLTHYHLRGKVHNRWIATNW